MADMKKQFLWGVSIVFLLAIAVGGYYSFKNFSYTPISEIKKHPRDYINKGVRVKGQVTKVFSLALVNYFEISDEQDTISVYTKKPLPAVGEKLVIYGKVKYLALGKSRIFAIEEE